MRLLPSIASSDPLRYGETMKQLAGWPFIHMDVEDGNFTPNMTFGLKTVSAICGAAGRRTLDVHLMVTNPCEWLERLRGLPIAAVAAHLEALPYPLQFINRAHALGFKAGLALNFRTPIGAARMFFGAADYLLLMTCEPDEAGEALYAPAFARVLEAARERSVPVVADGGLDEAHLRILRDHGVSAAVLGRLIFQGDDPMAALRALSEEGKGET